MSPPHQSKGPHGFHRKYIRLLFLFRMKTATVFLFQDYKGDVRDCEKLQGTQTDVGGHHCALRKTRGVMAEVAAEPHPSLSSQRRHGCTTLLLPAPLHQGCPNGLLCPWHVPRLRYGAWDSLATSSSTAAGVSLPLVTWMKGGVSGPCHLTHLLYSVIEQWPPALNSSLHLEVSVGALLSP